MAYPYVTFDEKRDGDVAEAVCLTVLKLSLNFVQERCPNPAKMVPSKFEIGLEFGDLRNPIIPVSSKSNEFVKLTQKNDHTISKGHFLGQFIEFVRLGKNGGRGVLSGR